MPDTRTICTNCSAPVAGRARFCPDCRETGSPWRVDEEALAAARERFGLKVPVVVRRVGTRRLLGRYHGIRFTAAAPTDPEVIATLSDEEIDACWYHLITISSRLTPEGASRSLWHELTHAAQYERDPDHYVREYARERREAVALAREGIPFSSAYRRISFEIEAKANEELHDLVGSLARPNRRASLPALASPHALIAMVVDGRIVPGEHWDLAERNARRAIAQARKELGRGHGPRGAVDLRPSRRERCARRRRKRAEA